MDSGIRKLERQAELGDSAAKEKLEIQSLCRLGKHEYHPNSTYQLKCNRCEVELNLYEFQRRALKMRLMLSYSPHIPLEY